MIRSFVLVLVAMLPTGASARDVDAELAKLSETPTPNRAGI